MIGQRTEAMDEEAFTDIANAMMRLRAAFMKHHLEPPVALELASRDDGNKFRAFMPRDMLMAQPAMGRRDDPDICIHLVGVEIRYPAQFRSRERGGFEIE